jgi:hypothetical protein
MDCYKYCEDIQHQINIKNHEIRKMEQQNAADGGRYSKKQLKRYSKLSTEFQKLLLDHQICVEGCKLRKHYSGDDSTDDTQVDPEILKELEALEKEEDLEGGKNRSTIRRRNKSKTKRRQTRSTRRRRSTRRTRKQ